MSRSARGFEDRFSSLLGRVVGALLVAGPGCTGATPTSDSGGHTGTDDLSAVCDGAPPPTDHQVALGFVEVAPGEPCPDAEDAALSVHGCTFLEWREVTCGFDHLAEDQVFVDDGYGGHYADLATVPTGYPTSPVVDVCWYEGVFYLPPDHPTCGRPLLRGDGAPALAEVARGDAGWARPSTAPSALAPDDRAAVARWWLRAALLEHASVASFAVFSLDLLRFGAPPDLVRDAHQAAIDEVEHARRCFALAGRFGGDPVGPGALDVGGPVGRTRAEAVAALVREGCVGETLAAVDAAARLAAATDPEVAAALRVIVRDESAHAALAWRALRWFLASDTDGALRASAERAFAEARAHGATPPSDDRVTAAQAGCGLLSGEDRARAIRRAWAEVVAPAWSAAT